MPVPIVTENHDGLKFRTILRQPASFLLGYLLIVTGLSLEWVYCGCPELAVADGEEPVERNRDAAGAVTAGLSIRNGRFVW